VAVAANRRAKQARESLVSLLAPRTPRAGSRRAAIVRFKLSIIRSQLLAQRFSYISDMNIIFSGRAPQSRRGPVLGTDLSELKSAASDPAFVMLVLPRSR